MAVLASPSTMTMYHPLDALGRGILVLLLGLLFALDPTPLRAEAAGATHAAPPLADATAGDDAPPLVAWPAGEDPIDVSKTPVVTPANLMQSERLWPYKVTLTAAWKPPGREKPLRAGTTGVLIRVESATAARVDFSADGKYDVPVDRTDLVKRANRIRRGEVKKEIPNFTLAIANRALDPTADPLVVLSPPRVATHPGFLCVFADPSGQEFPAIAAALAPLRDRHDVLTIFFPQGDHPDVPLRDRLRDLGWMVPFVYDFLSEPYTRTLLDEKTPLPAVLLQTKEGRVVFLSSWRADLVPELTAALDESFGGASARASETASKDVR